MESGAGRTDGFDRDLAPDEQRLEIGEQEVGGNVAPTEHDDGPGRDISVDDEHRIQMR